MFSGDTEANGLEKVGRCLTDLLQFLSHWQSTQVGSGHSYCLFASIEMVYINLSQGFHED